MPQLDKVTLFSQVFWLVFFYFFFFLVVLKYYLPKFSKLFKIRSYYTVAGDGVFTGQIAASTHVSGVLSNFKVLVDGGTFRGVSYYRTILKAYNLGLLKKANSLYVSLHAYNCLKLKLYRKLYL